MGSFSDYAEGKILDHVFKTGAYTPATNLYIALAKSTIADDDTGSTIPTEVSGGAYARKKCNTWDAASGAGATENSQAVTYVEATANWGTVTDFAIVDHSSTGNLIAYGKLTIAKKITTGDTAKFATGDIDITLT
jgi:hypothetical protein